MATWQTQTKVQATPEQIIDMLTDPKAVATWSPIDFDVEHIDGDRLMTGGRARVTGRLAGREVAFDIDVICADSQRLLLTASGPIEIDVKYDVEELDSHVELRAWVTVRSRGGIFGRILSGATEGLLGAGMLNAAVSRIAREVEALQPMPLAA
ncbi:MAG TPA: hypothetical protein VN606_10035 [Thermoleophilaceae bacterium]|jgi:hypothetical protein|nr:hypothetical protein [Thermoleophilaceae bacterium]